MAEVTVKVALNPLKVTAVAPVKFVPLIVTLVPTGPLVGVKLVIVGGGTTVNELALTAVPEDVPCPGASGYVVTRSVPDLAPCGTVVWIDVSEDTVKLAMVSLNHTA